MWSLFFLLLGAGTVVGVLVVLARTVRRDGLGHRPAPRSHDNGLAAWPW